jgi:hypothetical protein
MAYEVGNLGGGVAPSPSLTDALGKSQSFDPVDFSIGTAIGKGLSNISNPMGMAYGAYGALSNVANDIEAAKAMGVNYGVQGLVNSVNPFGMSMTQSLQNQLDVDKSGNISPSEISSGFGYNYGNVNDVVSSISPFGPGTNVTNPQTLTPYSKQNFGSTSSVGAVGSTGDLGGAKGAGYSGSIGGFLGFGKAEGVDTSDPNSTGASTGIGGSAAGVAGMGDESGAGTGSSSSSATAGQDTATSGPTGTSYSSDEQGSGGGSSGGGTYICTALYEMGDMKKSIYKYDQIYGKKVDPATYRGYELWGKYVASKLRNRGIVYKVAKPIALTWANQMAYDLSKGKIGKNSLAIKITKTIGEGCCYVLGQIFKRRTLWLKST